MGAKDETYWQMGNGRSERIDITCVDDIGPSVRDKQKTIFILGKIDMDNIGATCKRYNQAAKLIAEAGHQPSVFTQLMQTGWMHNIKGEIQQRLKHMMMCDGIYLLDDWVDCSICISLHLLAAQAKLEILNK